MTLSKFKARINDFFPIFATVLHLNFMFDLGSIEKFENIATPFYYYDMELLDRTLDTLSALSGKYGVDIHYAVKANVERRILEKISSRGLGADCVSGNEVLRALECGFPADRIVFAGVGKSDREIYDALHAGIEAFNCESLHEIYVVNAMAQLYGLQARVSVRINPDIDAHTHKYVTTGLFENKFGIASHEFEALVALLGRCRSVSFTGLHFHIGSQIVDVDDVFGLEARRAAEIVSYFEDRGLRVDNVDFGGGLGIDYEDPDGSPVAPFEQWIRAVTVNFPRREGQRLHLEPGRSVVAQCGSLISRVLFVKSGETKNFLVLDAGMNDLIRPALYGAYHKIENLSAHFRKSFSEMQAYDVVGPVCESSDVWGQGRLLPMSVRGDLMAIRSAGAYGQVMASRYNLRDFAPAVFSDDIDSAPHYVDYFNNCR